MFIVGSPRWERFHVCRKIAIMSYETPTTNYGIPTNANIPVPLAPSLSKMEPEQVRRLAMFQAMRWLEQQQPECPRIGFSHTVRDEKFRIRQTPAMSFAPTAIETWDDRGDGIPEIAQRSFGLLGPSGPLPAHWTELVRNRTRHANDAVLQDFFDIFHHRMACLFYRAWSSARPAVQFDRPSDDRFMDYFGSLFGQAGAVARGRDSWDDRSKRYFTGHLASQHKNAEGLASILQETINAPVVVHSFALRWLSIEPEDRLSLSSGSPPQLGRSALLGSRFPDRTSAIECEVGPLPYERFQQLVPGSPKLAPLVAIHHHYAGPSIDSKLRFVLSANQIPRPQLGKLGTLGCNTWLCSRPSNVDRNDACISIPGSCSKLAGVP